MLYILRMEEAPATTKLTRNEYFKNYRQTSEHYKEYRPMYDKKYAETHKEKLKEYLKEYYQINKARLNANRKANYHKHAEKRKLEKQELKRLGKIEAEKIEG